MLFRPPPLPLSAQVSEYYLLIWWPDATVSCTFTYGYHFRLQTFLSHKKSVLRRWEARTWHGERESILMTICWTSQVKQWYQKFALWALKDTKLKYLFFNRRNFFGFVKILQQTQRAGIHLFHSDFVINSKEIKNHNLQSWINLTFVKLLSKGNLIWP